MQKKKGFEGWYFKHQNKDSMVAFIPGQAQSGAFIQMISSGRCTSIYSVAVRRAKRRNSGG